MRRNQESNLKIAAEFYQGNAYLRKSYSTYPLSDHVLLARQAFAHPNDFFELLLELMDCTTIYYFSKHCTSQNANRKIPSKLIVPTEVRLVISSSQPKKIKRLQ